MSLKHVKIDSTSISGYSYISVISYTIFFWIPIYKITFRQQIEMQYHRKAAWISKDNFRVASITISINIRWWKNTSVEKTGHQTLGKKKYKVTNKLVRKIWHTKYQLKSLVPFLLVLYFFLLTLRIITKPIELSNRTLIIHNHVLRSKGQNNPTREA